MSLFIFFKFDSLALRQGCPSENQVTLKDMGKTDQRQTKNRIQLNMISVHKSWDMRYMTGLTSITKEAH